jgi:ketosteroid isomerase-like protein
MRMPVDHQALAERYAASLMKGGDLAVIDELFTEDYVDEYPQSGEVIRGRHALKALMSQRPGDLSEAAVDVATIRARGADELKVVAPMFTVVRVQGRGDAGTTTLRTRYPDGSEWWLVIIYELRDGRIAKSTTFFAQEFEPAPWRAPFVELRPRPGKG